MKLDPAGWPFVAVLAAAALIAAFLVPALAVIAVVLLVFTLNFFRDPERIVPIEPGAVVCPADGKVIRADASRISVFMNVFDVHVCRAPASGRVVSVEHVPGRFLAAMKDDASEHNERTAIVIEGDSSPRIRFVLVAGLIARRIVCRVASGATLAAGDRVGIIRFGSRVDIDPPPGVSIAVRVGDRVVAGQTILARAAGPGADRGLPPSAVQ